MEEKKVNGVPPSCEPNPSGNGSQETTADRLPNPSGNGLSDTSADSLQSETGSGSPKAAAPKEHRGYLGTASRARLAFLVIVASVLLDRIVKLAVVADLKPVGSVTVIDGVFALTYVENTGAAFSMLDTMPTLLFALRVVGMLVVIWFLCSGKVKHWTGVLSLAMIAGGGIGNMIDLPIYGYVVDMFEFLFVRFAIFNVADVFITCGVVVLAIYLLWFHENKK